MRSNRAVFGIALGLIALATRLRPLAPVDTGLYSELADQLLSGTPSALFAQTAMHWSKITFLAVLAAARAFSPDHWMYIVLAANILCAALGAVLLRGIIWRATRSEVAVAFALLSYLVCYDILYWVRCMLTDTFYMTAALAVFAVLVRDLYDEQRVRRIGLLILAVLGAMLSRPPGVLLAPLAFFVEWVLVPRPGARKYARLAIALLVSVAVLTPFARAVVVKDPQRWPFPFLGPRLEKLAAREKKGIVINDRPEAARPIPRTVSDHLVMEADRFARFFQFTAASFSRAHNLVNIAWYGSIYLLAIFGVIRAFTDGNERRRAFVLASLLWIFAVAWLHALTELDFDWRYRMPVLPQFIGLAACGVERLLAARSTSTAGAALGGEQQPAHDSE